MRFILRLSVGQQLALQLTLCALPLGYLGYRVGTTGGDGLGIACAAAALAGAGLLCIVVARRVAALSQRMLAASHQLARGNFAASTTDAAEPADQALAELRAALKARFDSADARAAAAARLNGALDKLASNVMVADADGTIVYMNEAVTAMFRANAAEIRKQLPHFDAAKVLGSSFDRFHKAPSHQRGLLGRLRETHSADVQLGESVLRVSATPIIDAGGQRLGTVVLWLDRTVEARSEAEIAGIVAAANDGNLTQRIATAGLTGNAAVLASGVNSLLDHQLDLVRRVQGSLREVTGAAEEISKGNLNLSQRTEEQASSLEETASSMEQMTSTVRQNADNASAGQPARRGGRDCRPRKAARSCPRRSPRCRASTPRAARSPTSLASSTRSPSRPTCSRSTPRSRRRAPASRAAASRWSRARSAPSPRAAPTAAKEIKALIKDSVAARSSRARSSSISRAQTLDEIVTAVKKVTDIVAEIAAASHEQAAGIEQVNKAVTQMDDITQQNAALVEEAAAAAESLLDQATELRAIVDKYVVGASAAPQTTAEPRRVAAPPSPQPAVATAPVERRSASRPWSRRPGTARNVAATASAAPRPRTAPTPSPAAQAATPPARPAPPRATGASGSDDWNEF